MAEQQPSNTNISANHKALARPGLAIANDHKEVKTQMQHVEKESAKGKTKAGDSKSSADHDNWKRRPLLLPQFRGIDERADEFIAKFRQDMKLEREQSILEFEEMLKRSA
ncbi:hypothetical protein BUALT_Bualt14G0114700 [Buddleja alternifolia]|uniref:Uncharacterized protein n=1 Tax=Buddleja alternifolia TaxID=168488 RepID=A0AAV6WQ91_9LAMI|nr:hypothetical protein BUALT_Bualt14G0114700 [Buddleja alternifolia]